MQKKEFFKMMEDNKGKDIDVEVQTKTLKNMEMQKYKYQLVDDRIYFRNSVNLNFIVINLNTIREIENYENNIIIYLDDNIDTKIKISVNN